MHDSTTDTKPWTRVPGGWLRKTKGGFYRILRMSGVTAGPYATESAARSALARVKGGQS